MTLIKKTSEYTIESEQSERKESSNYPEVLITIAVMFLGLCLMVVIIDPRSIWFAIFMMAAVLFYVIWGYTKSRPQKTIPTLKITLSEIPMAIRENNVSHIPAKTTGTFGTWRVIDVTKDIDELSRRIQGAVDSVMARYEEEKAFREIEAKKNEDHKACIADLEKQALEKLK